MDKLWIATIVLLLSPLIVFLCIMRGISRLFALAGDRILIPDDYLD